MLRIKFFCHSEHLKAREERLVVSFFLAFSLGSSSGFHGKNRKKNTKSATCLIVFFSLVLFSMIMNGMGCFFPTKENDFFAHPP